MASFGTTEIHSLTTTLTDMTPREIHILVACATSIGTFVGFFVGLRLGHVWTVETQNEIKGL